MQDNIKKALDAINTINILRNSQLSESQKRAELQKVRENIETSLQTDDNNVAIDRLTPKQLLENVLTKFSQREQGGTVDEALAYLTLFYIRYLQSSIKIKSTLKEYFALSYVRCLEHTNDPTQINEDIRLLASRLSGELETVSIEGDSKSYDVNFINMFFGNKKRTKWLSCTINGTVYSIVDAHKPEIYRRAHQFFATLIKGAVQAIWRGESPVALKATATACKQLAALTGLCVDNEQAVVQAWYDLAEFIKDPGFPLMSFRNAIVTLIPSIAKQKAFSLVYEFKLKLVEMTVAQTISVPFNTGCINNGCYPFSAQNAGQAYHDAIKASNSTDCPEAKKVNEKGNETFRMLLWKVSALNLYKNARSDVNTIKIKRTLATRFVKQFEDQPVDEETLENAVTLLETWYRQLENIYGACANVQEDDSDTIKFQKYCQALDDYGVLSPKNFAESVSWSSIEGIFDQSRAISTRIQAVCKEVACHIAESLLSHGFKQFSLCAMTHGIDLLMQVGETERALSHAMVLIFYRDLWHKDFAADVEKLSVAARADWNRLQCLYSPTDDGAKTKQGGRLRDYFSSVKIKDWTLSKAVKQLISLIASDDNSLKMTNPALHVAFVQLNKCYERKAQPYEIKYAKCRLISTLYYDSPRDHVENEDDVNSKDYAGKVGTREFWREWLFYFILSWDEEVKRIIPRDVSSESCQESGGSTSDISSSLLQQPLQLKDFSTSQKQLLVFLYHHYTTLWLSGTGEAKKLIRRLNHMAPQMGDDVQSYHQVLAENSIQEAVLKAGWDLHSWVDNNKIKANKAQIKIALDFLSGVFMETATFQDTEQEASSSGRATLGMSNHAIALQAMYFYIKALYEIYQQKGAAGFHTLALNTQYTQGLLTESHTCIELAKIDMAENMDDSLAGLLTYYYQQIQAVVPTLSKYIGNLPSTEPPEKANQPNMGSNVIEALSAVGLTSNISNSHGGDVATSSIVIEDGKDEESSSVNDSYRSLTLNGGGGE